MVCDQVKQTELINSAGKLSQVDNWREDIAQVLRLSSPNEIQVDENVVYIGLFAPFDYHFA